MVLGWTAFVPLCPRVSVISFDSCIILVNTLYQKDPASKEALSFLPASILQGLHLFFFFFPEVFWFLVEMLDSQPVPGDLSSGSWPDSPGGISKMQLNLCSLIRPTSPVWALALHGLDLPKALCSLSPVHPDWLTSRAVIFSFLSLSPCLLMTSEIAFPVSHVSQPFW